MNKNNSSAHASHFLVHFNIHCMTTTFYGGRNHTTTNFLSLFEPGKSPGKQLQFDKLSGSK